MCSELSALLHTVGKNIVSHLRDKTCFCKEFQKGRCNVSGRSCYYAGRQSCGHLGVFVTGLNTAAIIATRSRSVSEKWAGAACGRATVTKSRFASHSFLYMIQFG